jgi:hypothetical protein
MKPQSLKAARKPGHAVVPDDKLGSRPMTRFDGAQPVDEIRLLERIAAYLATSP